MRTDFITNLNTAADSLDRQVADAIEHHTRQIEKLRAIRPLIQHLAADDDLSPGAIDAIRALALKYAPEDEGEGSSEAFRPRRPGLGVITK